MKNATIALSASVLLLSVGCSDQNSTKPATNTTKPATSEVKKLALAKDLPADIKGFPFMPAGKCAVDIINKPQEGEVITISRADGLNIDGWAFDDKNVSVPSVVVLQLVKGGERYYALLNRHGGREDLTKAFGKPEFSNAGYSGSVDISTLPSGQYDILVIQKGVDKNMVCPTYRKLDLKG